MEKNYTESQRLAKEQFCRERGKWKWNDTWETILCLNERVLGAYSDLSSVSHKKGYLDAKTKELIYLAMDASISHMYLPGLKRHMIHAIQDLGILPEEILETLLITSTCSAATYTVGFPILMRCLESSTGDTQDPAHDTGVIADNGQTEDTAWAKDNGGHTNGMTQEQAKLRERFEQLTDYWSKTAEEILFRDEDIFRAYVAYLDAALAEGILNPKLREFVYIAVHLSPVTLNTIEIERHILLALKYGATREELLEIFEVVCCLGIHTVLEGVPIIKEICDGM